MNDFFAWLGSEGIPFPILIVVSLGILALIGWLLTVIEKYVFSPFAFVAYIWLGAFAVFSVLLFVSVYSEQYSDLSADGILSQSSVPVLLHTFDKLVTDTTEWVSISVQRLINSVSAYTNITVASICLGGLFFIVWVVLMLPLIDLVFNLKSTVEGILKENEERMAALLRNWEKSNVNQKFAQIEMRIAQLEKSQNSADNESIPSSLSGEKITLSSIGKSR